MNNNRTCIVCGKKLPDTRRKYCSDKCCAWMSAENHKGRRTDIDYQKVREQEARYQKSVQGLRNVSKMARESGMTYGQFVAKMNAPVIQKHRREKTGQQSK